MRYKNWNIEYKVKTDYWKDFEACYQWIIKSYPLLNKPREQGRKACEVIIQYPCPVGMDIEFSKRAE